MDCLLDCAWGLNTRMSKKALSCCPPQKPLAATSNRAPSVTIAVAPLRASPVRGCRCGSMHTLWQTSDISLAVKSLTSLWRRVGNPPLGHERACCTEKGAPQAQWVGMLSGVQPYLSAIASRKALLWREKPNSPIGRDVSQLEAPFS